MTLTPVFIGHDIYRQAAYGTNHPLAISRVETVMDLCHALGWLELEEMHVSPCATEAQLAVFHTREYIRALREASSTGSVSMAVRERHRIGTMENPLFPGLLERAATSVGGSIRAAELALSGRVVFHPAGGTHHGRPDRASGFCYFNDVVLAIHALLESGVERVLYVDLDAHHGDAVQDAYAHDARVVTVSVHEQGRWPYTGGADDVGGGNAWNLPVPACVSDSELRLLVQEIVLPLARHLAPEAVVITCGADALEGDPLSSMALSNGVLWSTVEALVGTARASIVLGGGGYNPWAVARYWTGLWGRLSGSRNPATLPDRAVSILSGLAADLIDEEDVQERWLTTLVDAPNEKPVRADVLRLRDGALRRLESLRTQSSEGASA